MIKHFAACSDDVISSTTVFKLWKTLHICSQIRVRSLIFSVCVCIYILKLNYENVQKNVWKYFSATRDTCCWTEHFCAAYVCVSALFQFGWLWCSIMELKWLALKTAGISLFTHSLNCILHKQQECGTLGHGAMWNIATRRLNLPRKCNFRKRTHHLQAVAPAVNKRFDLFELVTHVSNLFPHSLPTQITWNITNLISTEWNAKFILC